ncbi:MAG: 16S rRNA (adenine(1518)-N(6)/adenine(1519)-N(6))-dimethyltransferase RsmA [Candidatus Eremiobacterota bacterium]
MAKPRWSQHFLRDSGVVARILGAAGLEPGDRVLEIGPGEGALTLPMLERVSRVVACEIDPHWAARLKNLKGPLKVLQGDFLKVDLKRELTGGCEGGWKVVANLPYAITSPILEKLLLEGAGRISDMWLMVQKEVAERVAARGTRDTGALTIFVQLRAEVELLFEVPRGCFDPPPEVDSAVLHFRLHPVPEGVDLARLSQLVRVSFHQRRKMLKRSLSPLLGDRAEDVLRQAGIDPTRRPETLRWEDFVALERAWG